MSSPIQSYDDHHTGQWQYERALQLSEKYAADVASDPDPARLIWGEHDELRSAQLSATLAQAAYTRDLAAALGTVALAMSRILALTAPPEAEGESR